MSLSSEIVKGEIETLCDTSEHCNLSSEDLDSDDSCYYSEDSHKPPNPGFSRTADIAIDHNKIFDSSALVFKKLFRKCPFLEIELKKQPPIKHQEKLKVYGLLLKNIMVVLRR